MNDNLSSDATTARLSSSTVKIAYAGGMNVADYYIKGDKRWVNGAIYCRIEGSAINQLQAYS